MPFLVDTFTGTNGTLLGAHDPDTGDAGSWQQMQYGLLGPTVGGDMEINANRCRSNGTGGTPDANSSTYRNSTDPGADEYDIACVMSMYPSPQAQRFHWIEWRVTPTGDTSAAVDRYVLLADNGSSQEWELYKMVAGTATQLDVVAGSLAGNVFNLVIQVRNGSMAVLIDGVPTLSSTDTDITQRGRVALGASRGGDTEDHWIDNLQGDAVAGETQIPLGAAPETDTTNPFTARKTVAQSVAAEQDRARPLAVAKTVRLDPATEADLARPMAVVRRVQLGAAREDDAVNAVTVTKRITLGVASEQDAARQATVALVRHLNPARTGDVARPLVVRKIATLGAVRETDRALALTGPPAGASTIPPPDTGTTARPDTGMILRPDTGTVSRPATTWPP